MKALINHLKKQSKKFVAVSWDGEKLKAVTSYVGVKFEPHPDDKITLDKLFIELRANRDVMIRDEHFVSIRRSLPPEGMDEFFMQKIAELDTAEKAVLTQDLIDDRLRKDVDGNPLIWKTVTTETRQTAIPLAQYDIIPEVIGYDGEVYLTDGAVPTVVVRGKVKKDHMVVIAVRGEG